MNPAWPWVVLALMGAYHGLNPAMGWLFALALGLQEKRKSAVVWALLPIALGHAAAIAVAILVLEFILHFLPVHILKWSIAFVIFSIGLFRLFRAGHPRGAGMRVAGRDLFLWSFLMASAHGAGLMVIPVLFSHSMAHSNLAMTGSMNGLTPLTSVSIVLLATALHTAAMLLVAGVLALAVFHSYERVGLKVLRHAWFNFDLVWAIALMIAAVTLVL